MLKIVNEGLLDIFVKSNETLTQGQLVKLNGEGVITVAGAGDTVHGIVAQDVVAANVNNFKLDSVTHKASIGDHVGVYIQGGVYITDQFSGNVTAGAKLYSGAGGKLVLTASGSVVATAQQAGDSSVAGTEIRVKYEQ